MIELTDTHCHIQSIGGSGGERSTADMWSKLDPKLDQDTVVQRAKEAGVNRLVMVGCDLNDSKLALAVAFKYQNAWASIGIHPHVAKDYASNKDKREEFTSLLTKPQSKVVAIGECGLDYYYNHSDKQTQIEVLRLQLELARKSKLPVIFHVREAFSDFWPIFDEFNTSGVLHSFTDNIKNLEEALQRGLFIGVNGIATFTKNSAQTAMYKAIPLDHLLLETDSPFLTPAPFRGTINEPKNVRIVAEYLVELRGEELKTIADQTTTNARLLFNV